MKITIPYKNPEEKTEEKTKVKFKKDYKEKVRVLESEDPLEKINYIFGTRSLVKLFNVIKANNELRAYKKSIVWLVIVSCVLLNLLVRNKRIGNDMNNKLMLIYLLIVLLSVLHVLITTKRRIRINSRIMGKIITNYKPQANIVYQTKLVVSDGDWFKYKRRYAMYKATINHGGKFYVGDKEVDFNIELFNEILTKEIESFSNEFELNKST